MSLSGKQWLWNDSGNFEYIYIFVVKETNPDHNREILRFNISTIQFHSVHNKDKLAMKIPKILAMKLHNLTYIEAEKIFVLAIIKHRVVLKCMFYPRKWKMRFHLREVEKTNFRMQEMWPAIVPYMFFWGIIRNKIWM